MSVKEESEKTGLKLNIQNMKIMASDPITSWQIHGRKVETVTNFIFLGSKITADDDCTHEIKRYLLLGRKAMTKVDQISSKWATQVALMVKNPSVNAGNIKRCEFSLWVGKIPWRRACNLLQSSCLENPHGQSLVGYSP